MVQIATSALVAALLVAPTLAAPFADEAQEFSAREETHDSLSARDPRIGNLLKKVGRHAPGALSTAATVAGAAAALAPAGQPAARDLEELDARDPRLGRVLSKIGRHAPGAISGAATVAGAAAALAPPPTQRDLDFLEELAAREPIFGKIFKVAKKVAAGAAQVAAGALSGREFDEDFELSAREIEMLEELAEREPIFGKIFKAAKKVVGGAAQVAAGALSGRDVEEFTTREPGARRTSTRAGGKSTISRVANRLTRPDTLNAVAQISSNVAYLHQAHQANKAAQQEAATGATEPGTQPAAREFEDMGELTTPEVDKLERLAARDPIFGKIFKVAKKVAGGAAQVAAGALSGREFEDLEELSAREIEMLEELAERGAVLGKILKAAKKVVASYVHQAHQAEAHQADQAAQQDDATDGTEPETQPTAREFEDMDEITTPEVDKLERLAARDPIFGKIFKVAKKVAGGAAQVAAGALSGREFEDMEELSARELELMDELEARGPFFRKLVRKVKNFFSKAGASAAEPAATPEEQPAQRDLEDVEELAARDYYYDELD